MGREEGRQERGMVDIGILRGWVAAEGHRSFCMETLWRRIRMDIGFNVGFTIVVAISVSRLPPAAHPRSLVI